MAQPEPTDAEINAGTPDAVKDTPKPEPASEPASKPKPSRAKSGGHMPTVLKRSPDSSQKLIVAAMAIATANTVFANMRRENKKVPAPRIVIGGFAVAIGLLFMSELQSEFAEAMALVILVASLVGPNGTEIINAVTNLVGSDQRVSQIAASRRGSAGGGVQHM
jgi:hypothetical protein